MITAAGVGSGLDIESIITQLVSLERRPLERLEQSKSDVQVDISANGQLRGAAGRFQSAARALADTETLGGVSAASSDEDVLTLSASADADTQSHDVVVGKLATAHRLASNAYADGDTAIGTGTLDITIGSDTLSLTLDGSNNTLVQVRDAINASQDNPGVTASVINVDAGTQLVLTANDTGLANAISVTPGGGLAGFSTSQVGVLQDAEFTVDGFAVTSASNTVTDVISGVTLELKTAGSSTVSFSGDSALLENALNEFVNAYNSLRGNIKILAAGPLAGDQVLLGLERSINQRLTAAVTMPDSSTGYLFEAGVSFTDQGDLSLDSARLAATVDADPTRILDLFGADGALGSTLDGFLDSYTDTGGIIDGRIDGLQGQNKGLDRLISNAEFRLEKTEERLREQFTALDGLLAQLSVTSDYLSQQLQSLQNFGRNDR